MHMGVYTVAGPGLFAGVLACLPVWMHLLCRCPPARSISLCMFWGWGGEVGESAHSEQAGDISML